MPGFKRLMADETGGYTQKFIINTLIVVVVLIVIMAEVGPLIWFRVDTLQQAEEIANAVAFDYKIYKDPAKSLEIMGTKMRLMNFSEDEIRESTLLLLPQNSEQKNKVKVTVVKYAPTLITNNIKQLKRFSKISTSKEVDIVESTTL